MENRPKGGRVPPLRLVPPVYVVPPSSAEEKGLARVYWRRIARFAAETGLDVLTATGLMHAAHSVLRHAADADLVAQIAAVLPGTPADPVEEASRLLTMLVNDPPTPAA